MKKRLKSIICAAMLIFTVSTQAFAAAGDTVLLGVTPSKPVIDSSLSDTAPDWQESEAVNGVETNAGNAIFKNTVKNGSVYCDFENSAEVGSGGTRGVWAGGTTDRSPEIIPIDEVEYINSVMKESNPDSASAQPDGSAPGDIPVPGKSCLQIVNGTSKWIMHFALRIKLSENDIKAGQPYKLKFSAMGNSLNRGVWADFRPYSDGEMLGEGNPVPWTAARDLFDSDANPLKPCDAMITKAWNSYEIDITPEKSSFNSSGYTTLWLVIHNMNAYDSSFTYQYLYPNERIYFDNISLVPAGDEETAKFSFSCETEGSDGDTITAEAVVDGNRRLFTASGVCAGGKTVISKDFTMKSDDEIVIGDDRFTTSADTDGRIKLRIFSDGGNFKVKNVSMSKDIDSFDTRPLAVKYRIFSKNGGSVKINDIAGNGGTYSMELKKGTGDYVRFFGEADTGSTKFEITDANGERTGGKTYNLVKFFRNGAELDYTSPELLKELGSGRYYMEFDMEQDIYNTPVTLTYCGAQSKVTLDGWGTYGAEFDINAENITDNTEVICSSDDIKLTNITLKKTFDR